MKMLFIRRNVNDSYVISSTFGRTFTYYFYSRKAAIKNYRESYGLRYKHLIICDI